VGGGGEGKAAGDWEEVYDADSEKSYYYNKATLETRWTKPAELGGEEWVEFFDAFTGKPYYYNEHTGVTKWYDPRGGGGEEEKEMVDVHAHAAMGEAVHWIEGVDQYGMKHWENSSNGELRWTEPKTGLVTGLNESQTVARERRGGMKAMDHLQSEVLMEARAAEHAHFEKTGERRDYGMTAAGKDRFEGFD
jgi:hypothetical protein